MAKPLSPEYKQKIRLFSKQYYRQALNAWRKTDPDESVVISKCETSCSPPVAAVTTDEIPPVDGYNASQQELDESIVEIPESPAIVTKKLSQKRPPIRRKNRYVSEFINFEAEVELDSTQAFTDDYECTQRDLLATTASQLSYIDDTDVMDSQPIGQMIGDIDSRNARDMKSVYLRSLADRSAADHRKYKLQYNYDRNLDVYSQAPTEDELRTDYEMDSFCVPNDCVEFDSQLMDSQPMVDIQVLSPRIPSKRRKKYKRVLILSP